MDPTLFVFAMLAVVVGMMFFGGRKQRRLQATQQELQRSLETGDVVTTTSGLRGTVVDASYEDTVDLEIADGVVTTWVRAAVRDKIEATEPDAVEEEAAPAAAVVEEPAPAPSLPTIDLEKAEKDDSPNGTHRA